VQTISRWRAPARERRRLARAVTRYAREERERYHRGGVLEFETLAARSALYDQIAQVLEDSGSDISKVAMGRLRLLLAEQPPVRDYGVRAQERNDFITAILADLRAD
jgi:hypothetical protein